MADQRILYTDRMIGAGHPSETDTLNRLALTVVDSSGVIKSAAFPTFYITKNSTHQGLAANSTGIINWSTASYFVDSHGQYGADTYTVSSTGLYKFECNLGIQIFDSTTSRIQVHIYKDAAILKTHYVRVGATAITESVFISVIDDATAAAAYQIYVSNLTGATMTVFGEPSVSWFQGHKI